MGKNRIICNNVFLNLFIPAHVPPMHWLKSPPTEFEESLPYERGGGGAVPPIFSTFLENPANLLKVNYFLKYCNYEEI